MTSTLIGNGNEITPSRTVLGGEQVWCEIIHDGSFPSLDLNREKTNATRAFKVPGESLAEFAEECMPNGIPGQHPTLKSLFVDTIKVTPFSDGNLPYYQHSEGIVLPESWLCVVNYARSFEKGDPADPESPGADGDLLDCTINCTNEIMLLEGDGFKWAGEEKRIANRHQFPKIIPIIDREYKLPRVSSIPWAAIQSAVGCINKNTYLGCPAETLLYVSATISSKLSLSGVVSYGISHKFKERRVLFDVPGEPPEDPEDPTPPPTVEVAGWNHFFDTKTQSWRKTDPLVYTQASMAGILPGVT